MKLGTVEEEALQCLKAFEEHTLGTVALHQFRTGLLTVLDSPTEAKERVRMITAGHAGLAETVQLWNLKLFRPVVYSEAWSDELKRLYSEFQKAYAAHELADRAYEDARNGSNFDRSRLISTVSSAAVMQLHAIRRFKEAYRQTQHLRDCPKCPWRDEA